MTEYISKEDKAMYEKIGNTNAKIKLVDKIAQLQAETLKNIAGFENLKGLLSLISEEQTYDAEVKKILLNSVLNEDNKSFTAHGMTYTLRKNRKQYGTKNLTDDEYGALMRFINGSDDKGLILSSEALKELRDTNPVIAQKLELDVKDTGYHITASNLTGYATFNLKSIEGALSTGRPIQEVIGWSINALGKIIRAGLNEDESQHINVAALLRALADEFEDEGTPLP